MKRREFITLLGGAAAWPLAASAQQGDRARRIGVLMGADENDPEQKRRLLAFTQALADLGWTDGRNARMYLRWGGGDINRIRGLAQELVGLQPDIILTASTPATVAVQLGTRTIPIVFGGVTDPVAQRIVPRLDRPNGNITGFADFGDASLGGKWLELLSEIAPGLKRAAVMFNPETAPVSAFMPSFEAAARSLKVVPITTHVHSDVEIETAITALGREPGGGLVVMPHAFTNVHRCVDHMGGGSEQRTCGLWVLLQCQRRRSALLRTRPGRHLSSRRHLCRSHSARREAGRSPGAVADQV
jgi:putative ABC transport system substrate-binding protein